MTKASRGGSFVIQGGHPVSGTIAPCGNKNEALPLVAAALLVPGRVQIDSVPRIRDVEMLVDAVRGLGVVRIVVDKSSLVVYRESCLYTGPTVSYGLRSDPFRQSSAEPRPNVTSDRQFITRGVR